MIISLFLKNYFNINIFIICFYAEAQSKEQIFFDTFVVQFFNKTINKAFSILRKPKLLF